jgi:regulator of sirC expression with transglutaminase-like and TPR domain
VDPAELSRVALRRAALHEPIDLARAALAIAREEYPELDETVYLRRLDEMALEVVRALPPGATQERRVGRVSALLFHELGYVGNAGDYGDPRNSFFNEVIDRRTGIPITLSLVYMEVGRRCGLRVDGVGFPGHFLCKVRLEGGDLIVDAFHRGLILGTSELQRRYEQTTGARAPFDRRLLRAARPREILVRMLQNLRVAYEGRRDWPRALSAVDRMLMLDPENSGALRGRAQLYERLGGTAAAAADLERVLRLEPRALDADVLRARIRHLGGRATLLN